jgi:hypothetical protein
MIIIYINIITLNFDVFADYLNSRFQDVCNKAAKVMFETVKLFGCVAFEKSQANSCICQEI